MTQSVTCKLRDELSTEHRRTVAHCICQTAIGCSIFPPIRRFTEAQFSSKLSAPVDVYYDGPAVKPSAS